MAQTASRSKPDEPEPEREPSSGVCRTGSPSESWSQPSPVAVIRTNWIQERLAPERSERSKASPPETAGSRGSGAPPLLKTGLIPAKPLEYE